jgi:molybdate transport repressor ModE-like protein
MARQHVGAGGHGGGADGVSRVGSGRWAAIELRHLTTLEAVAREGSFRRAAQVVGYVQSTVSQQIAALETLTGDRLVARARGTHSVTLTAAGRALLAHANCVVAEMQAAETELEALHDRENRALRLGRVDRAGAALLARLVSSFQAREPALALQLEEVESVRRAARPAQIGGARRRLLPAAACARRLPDA